MKKKSYETPKLTVYGTVESITRGNGEVGKGDFPFTYRGLESTGS